MIMWSVLKKKRENIKPNVWVSITKTDYLMASKGEIWERPFIKFLNSNKLYTLPYSPRKRETQREKDNTWIKSLQMCLLSIFFSNEHQKNACYTCKNIFFLIFKEALKANFSILIFRMHLFCSQVKIRTGGKGPRWEIHHYSNMKNYIIKQNANYCLILNIKSPISLSFNLSL